MSDSFRHERLLFAVDTSGGGAGIVLAGPHGVAAAMLPMRDGGFARTEDLADEAAALFDRCGCRSSDLTEIAAVVGPGSYTGLRSGLAFLRGLAFVDGASDPLAAVAIGTLELLAFRTGKSGERVLAVWPAGKGRAMVAAYRCTEAIPEEVFAPTALDDAQAAALVAANPHGCTVLAFPELPDAAAGDSARPGEAAADPDDVRAAAVRAGLELRTPRPGDFTALAQLAAAKHASGHAAPIGTLLPVYVGQAAARPNTHGVAAAPPARRPE